MKWICPECRNRILWKDIIVDMYIKQIIKEVKEKYNFKDNNNSLPFKVVYLQDDQWYTKKEIDEKIEKNDQKMEEENNNNSEIKNKKGIRFNEEEYYKSNLSTKELQENFEKSHKNHKKNLKNEEEAIKEAIKEIRKFELFKNFNVISLFEFLDNDNFIGSYFQENSCSFTIPENALKDKNLEQFCNELLKKQIGIVSKVVISWNHDIFNIVKFSAIFATENRKKNFQIGYALEFLLCISYISFKEKQFLENKTLGYIFGYLLNILGRNLNFTRENYGKIIALIKIIIPDLHFPLKVTSENYLEVYENLSDFLLTLLDHLNNNQFLEFFADIYKAPLKEITNYDDIMLSIHFIFFFNKIIQKKNKDSSFNTVFDALSKWDKNHKIRDLVSKMNLNIESIKIMEY